MFLPAKFWREIEYRPRLIIKVSPHRAALGNRFLQTFQILKLYVTKTFRFILSISDNFDRLCLVYELEMSILQ